MPNEISATASLSYKKGSLSTVSLGVSSLTLSITGTYFKRSAALIPTTAGGTALDVSGLANVGIMCVKNNDATNYIDIMSATSGSVICRLLPGECWLLRVAPTVTAPAALANTAAAQLEYLILEI